MEPSQAIRGVRVRSWFRIAILALAVVALAGTLVRVGAERGAERNVEYEWFQAKYGPSHNSEHAEEWIIRDFFGDRRGGTFVDVGSYHYRTFSNTYYLEQTLGWSGVAVDAQEELAADYVKYRPRTRFFSYFVSDRSDAVESLFVPRVNGFAASSDKDFAEHHGFSERERKVHTITLNDLLDRAGLSKTDFISMDIELAEPKALAGFDIDRFTPHLIVVEAHPAVRQQLLDYFAQHRYRVVGRYLRADPENLWFASSEASVPGGVDAGGEK
jgi:FkbM family methyltransferase